MTWAKANNMLLTFTGLIHSLYRMNKSNKMKMHDSMDLPTVETIH